MALMTFTDARKLIQEAYSCFKLVSSTKHVALSPRYLGNIKSGILEHLNSELKLFSEKLDGVLIAYENLQTLRDHGTILDEQPFIHFDVQADFIIFQPSVKNLLKGVVNKIGNDHIGCLVHNCFNASIPKPRNTTTRWPKEDPVIGQEFLFEVVQVYVQNNILSMRGRLTGASLSRKRRREDTLVTDEMPDVSYSSLDGTANSTASQSFTTDTPPSRHQTKKHKTKKRDISGVDEEAQAEEDTSVLTKVSESSFQSQELNNSNNSYSHKKKKSKKHKHGDNNTPGESGHLKTGVTVSKAAQQETDKLYAPNTSDSSGKPPDLQTLAKTHKHKKQKKHKKHREHKHDKSVNKSASFHTSESAGEASGDVSDATLDSGIGASSPKLHHMVPVEKKHKHKRKHSVDDSQVHDGVPLKKPKISKQ